MLRIIKEAITFDDVLLLPAYSKVLPNKADLSTQLTQKISLNIPILSAAMDTVTEANLAIALAQEGGIGFIHKNMSVELQVQEVIRVKRYNNKKLIKPKCIHPNTTILELKKLIVKNGFASYPVVTINNELIGIVTKSDITLVTDLNQPVSMIMTPKEQLITVKKNKDYDTILAKMQNNLLKKVLVVDQKFHLLGMIQIKQKSKNKTCNPCKDNKGFLRVGAAVGIEYGYEKRIEALVNAGVDIILIDSSHGHSECILNSIKNTRIKYPELQIIGGNVATGPGALALVKAGVNAVKVGIGPGSICTTRIVTGVGVPQLTAIADVVEALEGTGITVVADGGIRFSGDIAKALSAGANCVMVGSLLAGTEESPGEKQMYQGRYFKSYRGMGSLGAMNQGSSDRYFQKKYSSEKLVPEGIEGRVIYKGKLKKILYQQMGGLRSCMGLTGCATINELRTKTKFIKISNAAIKESHIHDILLAKEAPNYSIS